jgi:hypothetical protein
MLEEPRADSRVKMLEEPRADSRVRMKVLSLEEMAWAHQLEIS